MTPEEIKTLGHAFFDGKTLQYQNGDGSWMIWEYPYCPKLISGIWRIKPDEPKKVKLEAWIDENGSLMHKANFGEGYVARGSWIRIPELAAAQEEIESNKAYFTTLLEEQRVLLAKAEQRVAEACA